MSTKALAEIHMGSTFSSFENPLPIGTRLFNPGQPAGTTILLGGTDAALAVLLNCGGAKILSSASDTGPKPRYPSVPMLWSLNRNKHRKQTRKPKSAIHGPLADLGTNQLGPTYR